MIMFNRQSVCYQILELIELSFNWCITVILTWLTALLCYGEDSIYCSLCKLSYLCNHLAPGVGLIQLTILANMIKPSYLATCFASMYGHWMVCLPTGNSKSTKELVGYRISAMCRKLIEKTKECIYLTMRASLSCKLRNSELPVKNC